MKSAKIIFVTGTDTGVGKTLLTALLLHHLRKQGIHALGMKPFCSGSFSDARLLREAQQRELSLKQITPFYFSKAVAPIAATETSQLPSLRYVVSKIQAVAKRCDVLLIEGVGGVLVPLRKDYFVADLIASIKCEVILVGRNKLGTLNHTLLSVHALKRLNDRRKLKIVLMDQRKKDSSSRSNGIILRQFVRDAVIVTVPFLGENANEAGVLEENVKKIKKTLAELMADTYFPRRSREDRTGAGGKNQKSFKSQLTVERKFID